MIPLNIDISGLIDEYSLLASNSDNFANVLSETIADEFMADWEKMVGDELDTTRKEYFQAMFKERVDNNTVVVGLLPRESGLAMMIEDGATSFDIKQNFEKSGKRKIKKDGGWYMTVPFRHSVSSSIGSTAPQLPNQIERIVRRANRPVQAGDLPAEYRMLGVNRTTGYVHQNPIYEGLQRRDISSTANENRGGYFTFRRVSDKTMIENPGSWVHPGFSAKKFMNRVAEGLESKLPQLIDNTLNNFLTDL